MVSSHRPDLPPAIILSASTNGLGVARGLHRAGVPIIAVTLDDQQPILSSRLPQRKIIVAGADEDARLLEAVLGLGDGRGRPVIIPTSDKFVDFMMRHRALLARDFDFCIPSDQLAETLNDKVSETEIVESIGMPMPRTARSFPAMPEGLVAALGLPIIIKPRSFRTLSYLQTKNVILKTLDEVREFYRTRAEIFDKLIAQEVIPGKDDALWFCSFAFNRDSELVGFFVSQKLRMSPPHFGVSTYSVSASRPEIVEPLRRLGKRLGYVGVGNVEFKFDSRDGKYKYIETNPRLPLSNYLDTVCGVNNAYNAYRLARGETVLPPREFKQRDGVMYLSLFEDAYARLKDGEGALRIASHYLSNAGHKHAGAYFTWGDPMPGLVAGYRDGSRVLASVLRKARGLASRQEASK
jgi:predicted ATP-grasp superfamily ATP-dependent carboligase